MWYFIQHGVSLNWLVSFVLLNIHGIVLITMILWKHPAPILALVATNTAKRKKETKRYSTFSRHSARKPFKKSLIGRTTYKSPDTILLLNFFFQLLKASFHSLMKWPKCFCYFISMNSDTFSQKWNLKYIKDILTNVMIVSEKQNGTYKYVVLGDLERNQIVHVLVQLLNVMLYIFTISARERWLRGSCFATTNNFWRKWTV